MKPFFLFFFAVLAVQSHALKMALNPNSPISSGIIKTDAASFKETGADWVRINCRADLWNGPADTNRHNGMTWFEAYDAIINDFVTNGIQVYMLVSQEIAPESNYDTEGWLNSYSNYFYQIVEHFKDRVRVYEVFNEPNNWKAPSTPTLSHKSFAKLLERIYKAVKFDHWGDPSWQVTIVSGGLFSHDSDNVAAYFDDTFNFGKVALNWASNKNTYGTYPLDGLGYHIYVKQGSTPVSEIQSKMNENLDAIWNVFTSHEGAETEKKMWISEFGWSVSNIDTNEQARNVHVAYNLFRNDSRIDYAGWFSLKNFGAGNQWGLIVDGGDLANPADRRPSWDAFFVQSQSNRFETLSTNFWFSSTAGGIPFSPRSDDLLQDSGVSVSVLDGGFYNNDTNYGQIDWLANSPTTGNFGVGNDANGAAILRDNSSPENTPSLLVQYNLTEPFYITNILVFGGWDDSRQFLHYDIDVSYESSSAFVPFIYAANGMPGVTTIVGDGSKYFSVSQVNNNDGFLGYEKINALRFKFYMVGHPSESFFVDALDGSTPDAIVGSVVREIDVFGEIPEPAFVWIIGLLELWIVGSRRKFKFNKT